MREIEWVLQTKPKPKKRKARYERKYSNAMWHADWHTMKNPFLKGLNLIIYLDDASRCVTGFGVFEEATIDHSIMVLRDAIEKFGVPGQILTDGGVEFISKHKGKKPKRTIYEQELLNTGITHLRTRVKRSQTNGKIDRFFQTLEMEMEWFDEVSRFIEHYNEERPHSSLDMNNHETPRMAFRNKKATDKIRKNNPKWMKENIRK